MRAFSAENFLIMIVDDNRQNLQIVGSILDQAGYVTTFALSGQQALSRIGVTKPDLILLDLMMPDMSGLQVCQILKSNPAYQHIPILFLTASQEQDDILEAFNLGAADYITKPFKTPELLARVRTHLQLKFTLEELSQSIAELEKLATTDPLTGISNRRYLLTIAEQEISHARRYDNYLSILIMDIDHFKQINDTYGHIVGDEVLRLVAQTIAKLLRKEDHFGRVGGEEFVGLLPHTPTRFALEIAQRLRQKVTELSFSFREQQIHITVSLGVATYQVDDGNIDQLLKRADEALFEAKKRGRNRVIVHPNDVKNLLVS